MRYNFVEEEKDMGNYPRHPLIERDPEVLSGKPTIKGTRLSVELILERLADGRTPNELLESYPRLTMEGIRAALEYGAMLATLTDDDGHAA